MENTRMWYQYSRQRTANSRQQTKDNRQETADSRQQTADSRQQTADRRRTPEVGSGWFRKSTASARAGYWLSCT
jgi:hypothetical protein